MASVCAIMDPRAALLTPLEAAKRLGITVRTLHRWEEAGYVHPIRTPTNHRRYDPVEIDALRTSKASA